MNAWQRAGLPRRHEGVHDRARRAPAARLPAALLHAAADVGDGGLEPLRLRGRGGLLLLRQLRFPAVQFGVLCQGLSPLRGM